MNDDNIKNRITTTLATMPPGNFVVATQDLLKTLGYDSERTLADQSGAVDDFIEQFPATNQDTTTERTFRDNADSVRIIFQVTDEEIAAGARATRQKALFKANAFEKVNNKSFIFAAVELNSASYPRGRYAEFTREINKRLSQPTIVLFKTAEDLLSLAFIHRRPHKRNQERDVLGSVFLIREINPADPHRAHVDILADLTLEKRLQWMNDHAKLHNFDGLLDAWLDALNTEELNKRFYRDLFGWFNRAVNEATFPAGQVRTLSPEEHVIRLITRLLFIWFIKEKGLIAGCQYRLKIPQKCRLKIPHLWIKRIVHQSLPAGWRWRGLPGLRLGFSMRSNDWPLRVSGTRLACSRSR